VVPFFLRRGVEVHSKPPLVRRYAHTHAHTHGQVKNVMPRPVADPEEGMKGDASSTGIQQFLPVKKTARR